MLFCLFLSSIKWHCRTHTDAILYVSSHRWGKKKLPAPFAQVETYEDMRANYRFTRETWNSHSSFTKTTRVPQISENSIVHLGKTATIQLNCWNCWGTKNFGIKKSPVGTEHFDRRLYNLAPVEQHLDENIEFPLISFLPFGILQFFYHSKW
jgi:hypothetical protein